MDVLRTPDERFGDLAGYPFAPHYCEVDADPADASAGSLRMHYVDEAAVEPAINPAETVVCLHGEPSWSYLYRNMIPMFAAAGMRCVAPDLVGFGRSDKPASRADYTYDRHVAWLGQLLFEQLDLHDITLVCQDWGGLLGLRLVGEHPERFARVVAANTFLPTGERQLGDAFYLWRQYSQEVEDFTIGRIVDGGCLTDLSDDVLSAYDAPFPTDAFKQGARQFPMLVPDSADAPGAAANRAAWEVLETFDRPFVTAFSDGDPVTAGSERWMQRRIPGAADQSHVTIGGGGHFLQEDKGPQLAQVVIDLVAATPRSALM